MAPVYEAAAATHTGAVQFLEIDVDHGEEISAYEKVKSIPLFLFYHEGTKISELSFAGSKPSQLQANMAQFFELIEAAELQNRGRTIEPQVTMVSNQFSHLTLDGIIDSSSEDSGEESMDPEGTDSIAQEVEEAGADFNDASGEESEAGVTADEDPVAI
jgi:hypothetical protein